MKRILVILAWIALFLPVNAMDPVKKWGQLQVIGNQLCSENGSPVVLRGVSLGWHNLWPRFYNRQVVSWLKNDWNATVVRAAMGILIEDNYLDNPQFALKCMKPVIESAISNGIYVIIDWHSHKLCTPQAVEFFGAMAHQYGKHPNIIYEIYNEPVNDSWESLKAYATQVIKEIRKYDKKNIVLVGCPHWDQDIDLVAKSPLKGFKNIMYTVHFYAATHKDELRNKVVDAIHQGIPVFISESGATEASGDGKIDYSEWQKWIDMEEANRISWIMWSISDKNESCSMLLPRASSRGGWQEDVIKPYGRKTREYLRQLNTVYNE
ncbi:MAG TPA: glycosyl hydrolase family 5 [Prevotella sp.]|nr:glycosyl hydrolase family 5 [Prevotella sp.]